MPGCNRPSPRRGGLSWRALWIPSTSTLTPTSGWRCTSPPRRPLRVERVHRRELEAFGPRVLPGGDMEEDHRLYLEDVAGYELGTGSTTQQRHQAWIDSLSCKVIRLDGASPIESNAEAICQAWWKVMELVKETGK